MKTSADHILTGHVGSLPRPLDVSAGLHAPERGDETFDPGAFAGVLRAATIEAVRRQAGIGIDVGSDGEISKVSYATYVGDRLSGVGGDSPQRAQSDLEAFPSFMDRQSRGCGTPTYKRPMAVRAAVVKDEAPLHADIAVMRAAVDAAGPVEAFLNSASPAVIVLFQPALPAVQGGRYAALDAYFEALNGALAEIPRDRARSHVCRGDYEGPHHCDALFELVFGLSRRAREGAEIASRPLWRAAA